MKTCNLRLCVWGLLTASAMSVQPAQARNEKAWGDASDIGRGLLIAAAFGIEASKEDWDGGLQTLASVTAAYATTSTLKEVFPHVRPDGNGNDSYPSSHTSTSFAAAASLQKRYGWEIGLPAHAAAAFVGLARVKARRHYWYDVVVGAAIGEAAGMLITNKHNQSVQVIPWGDAHGGGVTVLAQF